MGSGSGAKVEAKQAPRIEPVVATGSKLAGNPAGAPKYPVTVKNAAGEDVVLGCPNITRGAMALMNQHAVNGGAACHWGGGSAFAEIMSSIHGIMFSVKDQPWYEAYNFVNDAVHTENGVYALRANLGFDGMTFEDLKSFRDVKSKLTGHGEAHLNAAGVLVSNGPLSSGVPQAQGLCLADKCLENDRVTICTITDGASMEGEAKEAYSAIPGFAAKGKMNPFVLVISDNNTKLSGRIDEDSFSMASSLSAMPSLGWKTEVIENGHDLQTVYSAIEKAIEDAKSNPMQPVCLHVKTIKGYGVQSTVDDPAGGHGYPLKKNDARILDFVNEIFNGDIPEELKKWAQSLLPSEDSSGSSSAPAVPKIKVQVGISKAAIRAVEEGYPVFSVSADLQGSTGIATFQKTFPERFMEVGIAEANMISTGVGLSLAGFIPIVDTFARFGVTKGNLPLTMAQLSMAPVIGLFSHTGLQDAADGASHQPTDYFAAVSAIPYTQVVCCSCSDEAEAYLYEAIKYIADTRKAGKHADSVILFIGRESFPQYLQENASYQWGKAQVLQEGSDVVIAATGPMVPKAIEAGKQLGEQGVNATVVNNAFINRPDVDTIGSLVRTCNGRLVTIEDHQVIGGMGAQLSHALTLAGIGHSLKSIGIENSFGQSAYVADHLYDKHGMNAAGIIEAAKSLMG
jgi:transketolase